MCGALLAFPGILDATVYGVAVPGTEGRAGMATIVTGAGFDLSLLRRHLDARLPSYARPVFLRIRTELEVTDTFKHKRQELARDGFDPASTADAIYFDDPERRAFVAMRPRALCAHSGASHALLSAPSDGHQLLGDARRRSQPLTPCCRRPLSSPCR